MRRHRRQDAEGNSIFGSFHDEDQDNRSPGEEILSVDRRLNPRIAVYISANVDFQTGVRRKRPFHRPQKVLLISWSLL